MHASFVLLQAYAALVARAARDIFRRSSDGQDRAQSCVSRAPGGIVGRLRNGHGPEERAMLCSEGKDA